MAEPPNPHDVFRIKKTYTFNEAIEFMKMMDKYPTKRTIKWVKADTKEPVVIGYN